MDLGAIARQAAAQANPRVAYDSDGVLIGWPRCKAADPVTTDGRCWRPLEHMGVDETRLYGGTAPAVWVDEDEWRGHWETPLMCDVHGPQPTTNDVLTPLDVPGVARRLGVQVDTVYKWRIRPSAGLPEPDGFVSGQPWWWPETIDRWARASGRMEAG